MNVEKGQVKGMKDKSFSQTRLTSEVVQISCSS
jgi:hypothetical protein